MKYYSKNISQFESFFDKCINQIIENKIMLTDMIPANCWFPE